MSPITTHVLDTSQGCPGANIRIRLEQQQSDKNLAGNSVWIDKF